MKYIPVIASIVLGAMFLMSSGTYFLGLAPEPSIPEGSPMESFMAAFVPTGYFAFVKVCELAGGILVLIPRTRNLGLLVLGPIIINILAFHTFVTGGQGLANPMLIVIVVLALYLLWVERMKFANLLNGSRTGS